jgi:hypothetical protein
MKNVLFCIPLRSPWRTIVIRRVLLQSLIGLRRLMEAAMPELIVLVDFKAIYPRVPQGIFVGFPGVAHFLSFEEICQYPWVPQGKVANPWGTQGNQNTWGTFNIFKTSKHHKLFE